MRHPARTLRSLWIWCAALIAAVALAACQSPSYGEAEPVAEAEAPAPPPPPPPPPPPAAAAPQSPAEPPPPPRVVEAPTPPAAANGGGSRSPGSAAREFRLPNFPWPPPRASASMLVPREDLTATLPANPSLAAVGRRLAAALDEAGYSERSFYAAPGGFALVARLERIEADGTPAPDQFRFSPPSAEEPFSLTTYIQQLFFAPQGFYRQIVFIVNDQAFAATGRELTAAQAQELLTSGANRLPPSFERRAFSSTHEVTALVYEYRKGASERDVETLVPGRLSGRQHLERAGIALAGR